MMRHLFPALLSLSILLASSCAVRSGNSQSLPSQDSRSHQEVLFEDGNYAMFIHFGLYSCLEAEWKGKAYYGNAEWIMNANEAGIPVEEYMPLAREFNPADFNADEIVSLAKDAGMRYIVITSKHHEGFAMFETECSDFNIKDATPFGRDVIGELAEACHREGLGIGFYYSQFQDWTTPGGGAGPVKDQTGRTVDFEEYFRTKCVPQVEELTTKYGEIQVIWFDTPGDMDIRYSEELLEIVHRNQPGCLVSSRVGNGLGDYETLGDMEVPVQNVSGRWEGIDVMQVGWGFSKFDNEWKSPEYVLQTLLSTVARGGTFMMNIGPTARGRVPEQASSSLRKAGEWIRRYPMAVYGAGPSPWLHALPWGDAVTQGFKEDGSGRIYLLVYDWPRNGVLQVPGLKENEVLSAMLLAPDKDGTVSAKRLKTGSDALGMTMEVPFRSPDGPVSVIELDFASKPEVDAVFPVLDGYETEIPAVFAQVKGSDAAKDSYMIRFGEWKTQWAMKVEGKESTATWEVNIPAPGWYDLSLECRGSGTVEWNAETDEGIHIQDRQPAYGNYTWQRLGWLRFETPGKHRIRIGALEAEFDGLMLSKVRISPVGL